RHAPPRQEIPAAVCIAAATAPPLLPPHKDLRAAMKISTSIKALNAAIVGAILLAGASVILFDRAVDSERQALARQSEFKQLGLDLAAASDYLTNEARRYVQFGAQRHLDNYWHEVNETKTRDRVVNRLRELGAPQGELDLIEQAKNNSDALIK